MQGKPCSLEATAPHSLCLWRNVKLCSLSSSKEKHLSQLVSISMTGWTDAFPTLSLQEICKTCEALLTNGRQISGAIGRQGKERGLQARARGHQQPQRSLRTHTLSHLCLTSAFCERQSPACENQRHVSLRIFQFPRMQTSLLGLQEQPLSHFQAFLSMIFLFLESKTLKKKKKRRQGNLLEQVAYIIADQ